MQSAQEVNEVNDQLNRAETNQPNQAEHQSEAKQPNLALIDAGEPLPDANNPHVPKPWSNFTRACHFCPSGECLTCKPTSFHKTLSWTDNTDFEVPVDLILSQPGWHCCDCQGCRQSLEIARKNHKIPVHDLNQVFGPDNRAKIVRSDGRIQHEWRILAAVRLTEGGHITAIMCGEGAEDHPGQLCYDTRFTQDGAVRKVVPWSNQWKNVPLKKLIEWNPEVEDKAFKILGKWL